MVLLAGAVWRFVAGWSRTPVLLHAVSLTLLGAAVVFLLV